MRSQISLSAVSRRGKQAAVSLGMIPRLARQAALLSLDAFVTALALNVAIWLRFEGNVPFQMSSAVPIVLWWLVAIRIASNTMFGLHVWSFRLCGLPDALRVAAAGVFGSVAFAFVCPRVAGMGMPRTVYALEFFLATASFAALRFTPRACLRWVGHHLQARSGAARTLIVGAGDAAELLARDLQRSPNSQHCLVGFVSEDSSMVGCRIDGSPVMGVVADLPSLIRRHKVTCVLLADSTHPPSRIRQIPGMAAASRVRLIEAKAVHRNGKPGRVLVIGGAGYIGSALLPKLLDRGFHVTLLDLGMFGADPISNVLSHPRLNYVRGDFRRVDIVVEAMQDADAVVHLGGIVGDPACAVNESLTVDLNVISTKMLVEAAKAVGVQRFIFASTCSVYGASSDDSFLNEDSPLSPVSLYARSKIASEKVIRSVIGQDDLAPVILRFGTIYGLSGRTRFDLVVNLLTAMAIVDKKITVFGGDQWRPFVHVDDAAAAILKAIEAPLAVVAWQTLNVGSTQENYRILDVGKLIQAEIPGSQLLECADKSDKRNYRVSFEKIASLLDFRPEWTVRMGVRQVAEAFASGRIRDYKDPLFSNYKFLTDESHSRLVLAYSDWVKELLSDTSRVPTAPTPEAAGIGVWQTVGPLLERISSPSQV